MTTWTILSQLRPGSRHIHVEKLTYTCNTGWTDHVIFSIQWFRTVAPDDANPHSSFAFGFLEEVDSALIVYLQAGMKAEGR